MRRIIDFFKKPALISPGIYQQIVEKKDKIYRLHLRVEPDGKGVLLINAARILYLNQTATEYAKYIIDGLSGEEIVQKMMHRYRAKKNEIQSDYKDIEHTIRELAETHEDECPITRLNIDLVEDIDAKISAPHRMDLALTYKCDNDCLHCYVEREQAGPELTTDHWKRVIDRLWEIGIPHICFTGGEATLRKDLVELITYAEDVGMVTGLLTNGRSMKNKDFVNKMADAGIDHFQITLLSHDEKIHNQMMGCKNGWAETVEGIKNAVATPVYTITNTTITTKNADSIKETVKFLAKLGVNGFACNSIIKSGKGRNIPTAIEENKLAPIVESIEKEAARQGLKFIWYSPTEYCSFNPVVAGVGMKFCTAAMYAMCIEPDGMVLPCQSFFKPLGNILKDDWNSIWNNPLAVSLRTHDWIPDKCNDCDDLPMCGGGCPLNLDDKSLDELKNKGK